METGPVSDRADPPLWPAHRTPDEYYLDFGHDPAGCDQYIQHCDDRGIWRGAESRGLGFQIADAIGSAMGTFAGQNAGQEI